MMSLYYNQSDVHSAITDLHNCTTIIGAAFGPSDPRMIPYSINFTAAIRETQRIARRSEGNLIWDRKWWFSVVGEFFEDKKFLGGFSFGKRCLGVDRTVRACTGWVCGPLRDLFRLPNLKCISPP